MLVLRSAPTRARVLPKSSSSNSYWLRNLVTEAIEVQWFSGLETMAVKLRETQRKQCENLVVPTPCSKINVGSHLGTYLAVQWVRLCTPSAGRPDLIHGRETRSCMHAATKSPHATTKSPHATTKRTQWSSG